jgi:hypothetical protein
MIILLSFVSVVALALVALLVSHLYLATLNVTTSENVRRGKLRATLKAMPGAQVGHSVNSGNAKVGDNDSGPGNMNIHGNGSSKDNSSAGDVNGTSMMEAARASIEVRRAALAALDSNPWSVGVWRNWTQIVRPAHIAAPTSGTTRA